MSETCGKCGLPLDPKDVDVRYFGTFVAHAEKDCIALLQDKFAAERAARERAEQERDAIRELMNCYNLGGWTDAIAPMKRALLAESRLAAIRAMQVPEEPTYWIMGFERGIVRHAWNAEFGGYVTRDDYKAIRAFAEAV